MNNAPSNLVWSITNKEETQIKISYSNFNVIIIYNLLLPYYKIKKEEKYIYVCFSIFVCTI